LQKGEEKNKILSIMLNMIKQNTSGIKKDIQEVGCFFRSAQGIAEFKTNARLTIEEINSLWDEAITKGWVKKREMTSGAGPIINQTFKHLHKTHNVPLFKAFEIGTKKDGVTTYYPSVPKEMQNPKAFIQKIRQPKGSAFPFHFRIVDASGSLFWDPYQPQIKMVSEVYTILFNIILI